MLTLLPIRRFQITFAVVFVNASIGSALSAYSQVEPPKLWSLVVKAVRPKYPEAAMLSKFHGHGILLGEVDFHSGAVISVTMEKSTGSTILDQEALNALRQWKFKPKTIRRFRVPIVFTLGQGL